MTTIKAQKKHIATAFLAGALSVPMLAYAMPDTTAILAQIFTWMQQEMTKFIEKRIEEQTDALIDAADTRFRTMLDKMNMPSVLRHKLLKEYRKYRREAEKEMDTETQEYIDLVQGTASGISAHLRTLAPKQQTIKTVRKMLDSDIKSECNIANPFDLSEGRINCPESSRKLQNTMLAGLQPLPKADEAMLKQPAGINYESKRLTSQSRRALAYRAISHGSSKHEAEFVKQVGDMLESNKASDANNSSAEANIRTQTLLKQQQMKIGLEQYKSSLNIERLLGVLISQGEEIGLDRELRSLAKAKMHELGNKHVRGY